MLQSCIGAFGTHRFEPRYSSREKDSALAMALKEGKIKSLSDEPSSQNMKLVEKFYMCDVCVKCGLVVGNQS